MILKNYYIANYHGITNGFIMLRVVTVASKWLLYYEQRDASISRCHASDET